jgi:hypothetical protein
MAESVVTQALAKAAQIEGSTQALAHTLRVPQGTLERWMAGTAQMPLRAFLHAIELVTRHETNDLSSEPISPAPEKLTFNMGHLTARCPRCDGTDFTTAQPGAPLRFTTKLLCRACGAEVVHGNLIAQLAQDAVQHSRAMTIARARRQGALNQRGADVRGS